MATLTKESYQANLAALWALAQLAEEAPLADMLAMAERADTLGAVLDTTLYRAKMDALHEDMEMLRALETVQATVRRIGSRRGARAAELTP